MKIFLIRISFSLCLFILQSSGYSSIHMDEENSVPKNSLSNKYWKWDEDHKVFHSKTQSNVTQNEIKEIINKVKMPASASKLQESLRKALCDYDIEYMTQLILQFTYVNGGNYTVVLEDDFLSPTSATNINMQGIFMLTNIGNNFLANATSLKTFTFPSELNQLKSIRNNFLANATSLKTFTFPSKLNQLKSIGNNFLSNATSLKTLTFSSKLNQLESIGYGFLYNATSLKTFTFPTKLNQLKSIGKNFSL